MFRNGVIAIGLGLGLTLATFLLARESVHGGTYFIFFGPVVWGARQIARSLDG